MKRRAIKLRPFLCFLLLLLVVSAIAVELVALSKIQIKTNGPDGVLSNIHSKKGIKLILRGVPTPWDVVQKQANSNLGA